MATIAQVRDGMAAAIEAGCGLRTIAYATDNIPVPCAVITRQPMNPDFVFERDTAVYPFAVRVYVGRMAERSSQKRLDELTELSGSGSLIEAIQDETHWPSDVAGAVHYVKVTGIGAVPEVAVIADDAYLSVEFSVEVVF